MFLKMMFHHLFCRTKSCLWWRTTPVRTYKLTEFQRMELTSLVTLWSLASWCISIKSGAFCVNNTCQETSAVFGQWLKTNVILWGDFWGQVMDLGSSPQSLCVACWGIPHQCQPLPLSTQTTNFYRLHTWSSTDSDK